MYAKGVENFALKTDLYPRAVCHPRTLPSTSVRPVGVACSSVGLGGIRTSVLPHLLDLPYMSIKFLLLLPHDARKRDNGTMRDYLRRGKVSIPP